MSKPSRPASGFVPIGELAGTLPGIVPRGRAMTAQTWHHFTMLRQVNQLIEAVKRNPILASWRGYSPSAHCRAPIHGTGCNMSGTTGRTRLP